MYIFLDGLNEVSESIRARIIYDIQYYINFGVNIVVSCTDSFTSTLKSDLNGNPTILGDTEQESIRAEIFISTPSQSQDEELYNIYSRHYNVRVPKEHNKVSNPYLLRLAMDLHKGPTIPVDIMSNNIMKKYLLKKCEDKFKDELCDHLYWLNELENRLDKDLAFPINKIAKEISFGINQL